MHERPNNPMESPYDDNEEKSRTVEKETALRRELELANELRESREPFPFPGVNSDFYAKTKEDQRDYPGFSTPIDELLERFSREGFKIVMGKNPHTGNIFILPAESNDLVNDSLFPRHLKIDTATDEKLRELIELNKDSY